VPSPQLPACPRPDPRPSRRPAALQLVRATRNVPDDVDAAVAVRMDKQRLLHDGRRRFAILIEESVLRTGIGGPDVMAGQLGHLIAATTLTNVSIGIVPMRPNRTRWPAEDFWIFADSQVNVELVSGYLTVTQHREIAMYEQAFTELSAQAIIGPAARSVITAAIDDLSRSSHTHDAAT
jgi:Domain of unknown function (DUF5753)